MIIETPGTAELTKGLSVEDMRAQERGRSLLGGQEKMEQGDRVLTS